MLVKRCPMSEDVNFENYNTNNLHEYDPYMIDDEGALIIDQDWWSQLTLQTQEQIQRLCEFRLEKVEVPHKLCPSDKRLNTIYWAYLDSFDYQCWYKPDLPNGPKDVILIPINSVIKKALCGGEIEFPLLEAELEKHCDGREFFVRLSGTSGKNEKSIRPFTKSRDIIRHLSSVRQFFSREYEREKETFLLLIPWNEYIEPRYELRIFVVHGKLTAASPQRYWELNQYSSEELDAFETALRDIVFIPHLPYHTFVADVFLNIDTSTCHLIEANPFGAHSGAGSSFFNWIDDYALLHGTLENQAEFRYLSTIHY